MKKLLVIAMAIALLLTVAGSLMADDFAPPSWRGLSGSTWQQWEFSTGQALGILPDHGYNPYGNPTADVTPAPSKVWYEESFGRTGVWPLSGLIDATIPNQDVQNPYKDIWIQLTWHRTDCGDTPTVWETISHQMAYLESEVLLADGWYHTTYSIRLVPNPALEIIRVQNDILVDELVIDTRCVPVPEPSGVAVMLAGLASLGGFARLRRKSR